MRRKGTFARSIAIAALLAVLSLAPLAATAGAGAGAQEPSPAPATEQEADPGLCTPWHRCLAITAGGVVVLWLLSAGAMFALQRRGFDSVEHKQGSPQGVPVPKE